MTTRVYRSLDALRATEFPRGTAVAIGKFDGVHLGHRQVIEQLHDAAAQRDLESLVFTFTSNPLCVLRPELCPAPVMSPAQRVEAISRADIDAVAMIEFTIDLAKMPAEQFAEQVLVAALRAQHVIVGEDFRFGNRGAGDPLMLAEFGRRLGFTVETVGEVADPAGGRVSATRIRQAITSGEVAEAARMLGHDLVVRGEVVHGAARGRELGFPTANLGGTIEGLVPADGVYAGRAIVDGVMHLAAISVGNNPTFTPEGQSRVEVFLLDFAGDLYGKTLEAHFVQRIRGMVAFTGIDDLIVWMENDVREARELLAIKKPA